MKILVVDDEYVSRNKMQLLMRGFGECVSVESGTAALDAFKKAWESWTPFDVMSLDISMPDMQGSEVLAKVKQIEKEKNVPEDKRIKIIMVTAKADKDSVINCKKTGCDDYIVKPFELETVIRKMGALGYSPLPTA